MTKVLGVGGGSGGHITPVVAVFKELQQIDPTVSLRFWTDKKFGSSAKGIFHDFDKNIQLDLVVSGRFRRFHGLSKWHLLRPSILFPNLADMFRVGFGFCQSFVKLLRWRPDVIFMKGGYVCLPVGYAARLLGIPIVLHDSDAHPGLTNRLLSPFSAKIGTGAPLEYYNYPPEKATYVGIPVASDFRQYTDDERQQLKVKLGFASDRPLIVVTGGGLGAVRINNAVASSRDLLLSEASVFLISGNQQFDELSVRLDQRPGWRLEPFIRQGMAEVLAAADLVVARAGATTLAELAALHKPTIIVPNGLLTAGHQLKNAKVYQDSLAAVIVKEEEMGESGQTLAKKALQVLKAPKILHDLGENFGKFARPNASKDMAEIVLAEVKKGRG